MLLLFLIHYILVIKHHRSTSFFLLFVRLYLAFLRRLRGTSLSLKAIYGALLLESADKLLI